MKLSKRFKVGIFSWMVLIIYFFSDNPWIGLITFEILMGLSIYDGKLTKKSESYQLVRGISLVILGLLYMVLFFQKMHTNSMKNFNKNYQESNTSTTTYSYIREQLESRN